MIGNIISPVRVKSNPNTCRKKVKVYYTPNKHSAVKNPGSGQETRRSLYDKDCCGHISKSMYASFLNQLQKELKRLNFKTIIIYDENTIFEKTLTAIRVSIDQILQARSQFPNLKWPEPADLVSDLRAQEVRIKSESEKIKIVNKHLEQYDLMLQNKDLKLQDEEKSFQKRLSIVNQEEIFYEQLKLKCLQLEQENRCLKKRLAETQLGQTDRSSIDLDNSLIENRYLRSENNRLKKLLSETHSESAFIEQKMISLEKIKLEQEKIELAQQKFYLEQEKSLLSASRADFEKTSRAEIFESSFCASENLYLAPTEKISQDSKVKEIEARENYLNQYEAELMDSMSQIKEKINSYNSELEVKEKLIENLIAENKNKEKILNEKIVELKLIEESLVNSKQEMNCVLTEVFPMFENYSYANSQLLADLCSKKQEINEKIGKIEKIIESTEEFKEGFKVEYDVKVRAIEEKEILLGGKEEELNIIRKKLNEKEISLNEIIENSIVQVGDELQKRLDDVKKKEEELDAFRAEIIKEKEDNERAAVMLKMTHLEFENEKSKQKEKLEKKKKKLKEIKEKLFSQLKTLPS